MAQATGSPPAVGEVHVTHVTGRRVLATLVDGVIVLLVSFVFSALFGSSSVEGGSANLSVTGLPAVVLFVLVFGYYIFMEGRFGQTVGKMLLGIRVVRDGTGGAPGFGKAAIRTVLRIVDGFFFYLVGFVVVLVSGKDQRLGDMAAGTLVVRK